MQRAACFIFVILFIMSVFGCTRPKNSIIGTWQNETTVTQDKMTGHLITIITFKKNGTMSQTANVRVGNLQTTTVTSSTYSLNDSVIIMKAKTMTIEGNYTRRKELPVDSIIPIPIPYKYSNGKLSMAGGKGNMMLFHRIR